MSRVTTIETSYRLVVISFVVITLLAFTLGPIVYDTIHLRDTLFLTEIGWRAFNGFEPIHDFNHLYGGVTAEYIAMAIHLTGPAIKSLDYATVLMLGTIVAILGIVSFRRVSGTVLVTLFLLCASVMLARAPLEKVFVFMNPISAHSFIYNRFGTCLMICVAVFALLPAQDRRGGLIAAFFCGVACYVLVLTKPTLFLPSLAVILCLLIQSRFNDLLIWILGLIATALVLDFGFDRVLGSFNYSFTMQGEDSSNLVGLFKKAIRLGLVVQFQLGMMIALAVHLFWVGGWAHRRFVLSGIVVMTTYFGTAVTFGTLAHVGQQTLPFVCLFGLAATALIARATEVERKKLPSYGLSFSLAITLLFALPHLANTVLTAGLGLAHRDKVEIAEGPMSNLLGHSGEFPPTPSTSERERIARRAANVKAHIDAGGIETAGMAYAMLADGLELLNPLGDLSDRGVVSGSGVVFSFAVGSRPVLGYPVWVRAFSPELAAEGPMSTDIDIILVSRLTEFEIGEILLRRMGRDFRLCRQSGIWNLFVREGAPRKGCNL